MTKRIFLTGFVVLALLAAASMVLAQPGGQGAPRGQAGQGQQPAFAGSVLGIEDARTALGVTADQWQKLQNASRAVREANPAPARTGGGGGGAPGATPNPAAMAAARERQQKIQEETRKAVESILSADQVAKLDAMTFQRTGGLNPPAPRAGGTGAGFAGGVGGGVTVDALRALNLTDDQKKKVQDAVDKRAEANRALGTAGGGPNAPQLSDAERTARREATQKINDEFFAAVKSALTDDQKAKAEELMKDVPEFLRHRAPAAGGTGGAGGNRGAGRQS